jgi:hypothetical protein
MIRPLKEQYCTHQFYLVIQVPGKDLDHGYLRTLWQENFLRPKPPLVEEIHTADIPPELANHHGRRKWA